MTLTFDHLSTIEAPVVDDADVDAFYDEEDLWAIIVWNDDVTTFQTVIQALVEIFHHSVERADQLAWTIHRTGRAVAAVRPKEEAEAAVRDLHRRKISASLARA
jgi:ATP-dependent Clp protease adaptor protein ClpS